MVNKMINNIEIGQQWPEEVFCKRCNKETKHSLYSIQTISDSNLETQKRKIYCLSCKRVQSVRDKNLPKKVKTSTTDPVVISDPKIWETEVKGQLGIPYVQGLVVKEEQFVEHFKFGIMKCLSVRSGKADFLTSQGIKVLVISNV